MSQQMSIPQLQGQISNMRGKVQQCGAGLQAARKAAEQAVSEFRSKESRRDSLEERVDDLRDRISDLHNEMSSLDDEDEASRDNLRSEIRGCSEMIRDYSSEIRDIEQEMSQLQQRIQVNQQRSQQYAGILTQCREALKQIDQQLVGHIQERSQAGSRMEVLQRMNYASTAGSPAGKLSQDVTLCEQERQKVASMQSEITRYLDDGVVVQAPEAQKKTYSGPGGAGRASPEAPVLPGLSDNSPGADSPVLPGLSAAVDSGPSHIETAKTVGAPVAAPSMVSMAPPGNGAQVDVSDIRQAAEANRGKWADAGGFSFLKKIFNKKANNAWQENAEANDHPETTASPSNRREHFVEQLRTADYGETIPIQPSEPKKTEPLNAGQRVRDIGWERDDDTYVSNRTAAFSQAQTAPKISTSFRSESEKKIPVRHGVDLVPNHITQGQYFSKGNHYTEFQNYWENIGDYEWKKSENKVVYVKARDIEGLYLNDREVENLDDFWTRFGRPGYSKEKILSDAAKIPQVKACLDAGQKLSAIRNDPNLKDTVDHYFGDSPESMIKVVKCGSMLVFREDGRHRTLAAQYIDGYIPVVITGEYVKK